MMIQDDMPQDDHQHRFLHKLGAGAYGDVYLAEDTLMGERVAIKIPTLNEEVDLSVLEDSLQVELGHLKKLCPISRPHPHIVQPKGIKQFRSARGANLLGIITEFVPGFRDEETRLIMGCNLENYLIGQGQKLEPRLLVETMNQVCAALAHAHRMSIFHRDIKPSNILVRLPEGIIKVADWGVAKNIEKEGLWTKTVIGSRPYMAPEVLALSGLLAANLGALPRQIDHRADIYSLGVTLFKIVIRAYPFRKGSEICSPEYRAKQTERLAEALEPRLAAVIMRAMEFDPANRFQTAEEFAEALRVALTPSPLSRALEQRVYQAIRLLQEALQMVRDNNQESSEATLHPDR